MVTREQRLAAVFVDLADTLVSDFDVTDLLHRLAVSCVELLGADEAGILLADGDGTLHVIASSSHHVDLRDVFGIQAHEGPCLDAYRSARAVRDPDLGADGPWRRFRDHALAAGYHSVEAMPLRLRDATLGALNLLHRDTGGLSSADLAAAQALADVATIALLQERAMAESLSTARHLRRVLDGYVAVEQAKGMLAERRGLTIAEAFELMRTHAIDHNLRIVDVAEGLLRGHVETADLRRPPS